MEEEAEGAGDGDERLLNLELHGLSNDLFDVRAGVGVEILPELRASDRGADARADEEGPDAEKRM